MFLPSHCTPQLSSFVGSPISADRQAVVVQGRGYGEQQRDAVSCVDVDLVVVVAWLRSEPHCQLSPVIVVICCLLSTSSSLPTSSSSLLVQVTTK